jgi:hypothetical protein
MRSTSCAYDLRGWPAWHESGLAAAGVDDELQCRAQPGQSEHPADRGPAEVHMLERPRDRPDTLFFTSSVSGIVRDAAQIAGGV